MSLEEIIQNQMKHERLILLNDIHVPYHDKETIKAVKKGVKYLKPDILLLGGDVADFYSVSSFNKDPERLLGLRNEVGTVKAFLKDIKDNWGAKQIKYMKGNHESVTKDTDILTNEGWKNVQEVNNEDLVAQFDIKTKEVTFDNPISLISHYAEEVITFESNNMKQSVTLNHDIILNDKKVKAKELLKKELTQNQFPLTGNSNQKGIDLSDEDIQLLTWVIMDGTIVDYKKYNPNSKKIRVQFKLSKQRKINSLKELLNTLDINYTFKKCKKTGVNKLTPYYIRIYGDEARRINSLLESRKEIPHSWKDMNQFQLNIFLDTLIETDGYKHYKQIIWGTTNKSNIDIIQEACIKNGLLFKYKVIEDSSGFDNGARLYTSTITQGPTFDFKVKITKEKYNDISYCFTMPKGTLITRLDGKTAFTGNSRLQKYITKNSPELHWVEGLKLPNILGLDDLDIKFIDNRYWVHKGVMYSHLDKALKWGGASSKNIGLDYNIPVVHTHTHKVGHTRHGDRDFYDNGCLCELEAEYVSGPVMWNQSFMVVDYLGDKPHFRQVNIKNHQYVLDNKLYTPKGVVSLNAKRRKKT